MSDHQRPVLHRVAWAMNRGFSLVELLISLLLAALLSLAMSSLYLSAVRQFEVDEALARIQESGRFALQIIEREIQLAGFLGVRYRNGAITAAAVSGDCVAGINWALQVYPFIDSVDAFDGSGAQALTTAAGHQLACLDPAQIVVGSDLLIIKRTAGDYTVRNGELLPGASVPDNQWYLRVSNYGEDNSWVFHSDGNLPAADTVAGVTVDYWAYNARIFYLRTYSQSPADAIPSLCVEALAGGAPLGKMTTRCLVEGVEDMEVEFGIDSDADGIPNRFTSAPSSAELGNVVLARIFLLVRSLKSLPGSQNTVSYPLGGRTVTPPVGYLRRVFSATVRLSNVH